MELIEAMEWRYATKQYSDKKVSDDVLEKITKAIHLSASSYGIQPYKILVIENPDVRKKLSAHSFNPQINQASHLLVFAAFDSIKSDTIEKYVELIAKVREIPIEDLSVFKEKALNRLLLKSDEDNFIWATKQAYIALGTGMIAAAVEKVDATPMEGFIAENFDEMLGLKEKGLRSVALLSLGYRDVENDSNARLKKVRWPREEFITTI
ncbi:nitroreductase family protein [Muricauda oceani]|uniref:NAD(P)H-dependent oxidoreductase n=1 Tax=Flagellimonas oceani TaxID=2698672 RepID=A0A6G7IZF3_9FLAO|nr:nitroreductase family protein [Allomuricauda oceani]MBW8243705.1 nitroreductase family protein [Allomuricauda oceani]QII43935.1 NAD(P)H-dependent oxidoreductase [Allomuricauda oceani]